ncbi:MAG: InlB B-repeat-containing protein, partial [Kiritimatiellae bacterium]|nr:InlB B-repeat-containing protein [Kiritimatiellia bacterium]
EIVAATPSSGFYLDTSWGLLGYVSSSGGGNVLTFAGTIHYSTSDGTTLAINGFTGLDSLTDLAGNAVPLGDLRFPRLSSAIVAPSVDYSIAYDLAGGALPPDEDPNPDAYNYDSDIIALTNPILAGYNFAGWFAQVEDGRAELLCPAFILEKYRERVASETQKPCLGLFLSVTISPRPSSSTEFAEILEEELGDYLQ